MTNIDQYQYQLLPVNLTEKNQLKFALKFYLIFLKLNFPF